MSAATLELEDQPTRSAEPMRAGAPALEDPVRRPSLPALTGIRTLLAIGIILFHFTPPHLDLLYPVIGGAYIFVRFFFLLSGFVLTYNYADRAASLDKRDFWVARLSRLYPVYLLVLLISIPMLQDEWLARPHADFWRGLVLTPFLLQGWSPNLATFGNTVAWTLSCEVMFYLAFPFLLQLWATRLKPLETPARLVGLFFALWVIGILPHALYAIFNPDHLAVPVDRFTSTSTHLLRFLRFTPLPYLCTFLEGVALARLHVLLPLTPRTRFAVALGALALFALFFYSGAADRVPYLFLHGGLLVPLFSLLTLGLAGPNLISAIFSVRPLVLLGEATFALYLMHFNVYILIHNYHLPERLHVAAYDPWVSYAALLLLAVAAFRLVETPARKAILRRFSHRAKPATMQP